MVATRLTTLDASFLEVESPSAHMHVGWAATFAPPTRGPRPRFEQLRDHVAGRMSRAPRYRQRLEPVPLGVHDPVWVDDEEFDVDRHVIPSTCGDLAKLTDRVLSRQLPRDRPLWEMWISDELDDGRIGVVGKAHHAMVDGVAAVELASLLLDPTPDTPPAADDDWAPRQPPSQGELLVDSVVDRARATLDVARLPLELARNSRRLPARAAHGLQTALALADSLRPAASGTGLNETISAERRLARVRRPLADLKRAKAPFGATVNDVVLTAAAGAIRSFQERRGRDAVALKAMVPVSYRAAGDGPELGNQISFVFVDLPCDEPDPAHGSRGCSRRSGARKRGGRPAGADRALKAAAYAPRPVRKALSHVVASPRTFNLVVSNIPGPSEPLFMLGCELEEVYPVVPLVGEPRAVHRRDDGRRRGVLRHLRRQRDRARRRRPRGLPRRGARRADGMLLITGATGFVGMEVLARYLDRTDRRVCALVRADDVAGARERVRAIMETLYGDRDAHAGRVVGVPADLEADDLALAPAEREHLAGQIDEIVHCAASVSFSLPLGASRAINVEGTRRMVAFARLCARRGGLRRFAYVSTAYVAGTHRGAFSEDDLEVGQRFNNPYEHSKFEAERLVREHRDELPVQILRPSIVVGERGSGWTMSFNVLYAPLKAFARGAFKALPGKRSAPVDVVPVDYVADAVFELGRSGEPGTFALVAGRDASTVGRLVELSARYFERPAPRLLPPGLYRRVAHPLLLLATRGRRRRALRGSEVYFPYFDCGVRFDDTRARERLEPAGVTVSNVETYFERLADFAVRTKWGRRAVTRAT